MSEISPRLQAALADHYRLERELGSGGMATVYLAEDIRHHRRVAVKVLRPDLAATMGLERFAREIEVAARLTHPHILGLIESGERDGFFYYVMPYVEGETLRDRLGRSGELPVPEAVRLLTEITEALAVAHQAGVVHRDIKPDNILLSGRHAMVMDFGVAKAVTEATGRAQLTTVGVALGTPTYMAPEQAAGDPAIDQRADLYAVGVVAYEMLTGRPPFSGPTAQAVLAAQVTQPPPPITQSRPTLPPVLASAVMRCLEKRPADRWQSANDLLQQLEGISMTSGGTAATMAVASPTLSSGTSPVAAAGSHAWRRSTYLVLGVLLTLATAFAIVKSRGQGRSSAAASRRVVVLPFENLGDSSRQYFANGVTEAITTQLTGIAGLSVIPRSTAARYKAGTKSLEEIGRELGVGYVLEGTVQWEDTKEGVSRVRVSPELIRISDTSSVWAHGYESVMASVFQVYSDVAQQVAKSLEVALNDPERRALAVRPTDNPEAYDRYLLAVEYINRGLSKENFEIAIPMLERAVALDPGFALAWGRLSEALALTHWLYINRTEAALARAKLAAERALALAPDLPEAHRAMGRYHYWGSRDYPRALAELAIAQQIQPNNAEITFSVAFVLRRQGRMEEAVRELRKGVENDPGSVIGLRTLAETLRLLRRYEEAKLWAEKCAVISPDQPDCYSDLVFIALSGDGDLAGAASVLKRALLRVPPARFAGTFSLPTFLIVSDDSLRRAFSALTIADYGDSAAYYSDRASLARLTGQPELARVWQDSARVVFEGRLRRLPDDYGYRAGHGLALARLGRFPEAIREGKRAVELLPPERDAYFGIANVTTLALIYALAGQAGPAVEQLEAVLAVPGVLSPAYLRLDPVWDGIRGDAGFRALVR